MSFTGLVYTHYLESHDTKPRLRFVHRYFRHPSNMENGSDSIGNVQWEHMMANKPRKTQSRLALALTLAKSDSEYRYLAGYRRSYIGCSALVESASNRHRALVRDIGNRQIGR